MTQVVAPTQQFWQDFTALANNHRAQGVHVALDPSDLEKGAVELWISTEPRARGSGPR